MPESPDARLIERLRSGDADALTEIYDRFCERLYRAAIGLCDSKVDAEDAVHDTFVGLWRFRARIAKVEDLTAYLFASLRHAAARQRQRQCRHREVVKRAQEHVHSSEVKSATVSEALELEELLSPLPMEQRELVVMKIYGGLTFAEVAAALGISPNTAASRYRYALEKIRNHLMAEKRSHE
jgi:RNA polymerase sigma-70 factor, ECF subfamily